jgi:3-phenylpropionate/trans-cinnamate dioxygenase ferredoxin subunit
MRQARYAVAKTGEIPLDRGVVVPLGPGGECAVFFHAGRYFAVGSLCPHQNASLDGAPAADGCLVCKRHGYRFDLATGDCRTLAGYGLPSYRIEVEGDTLFVTCWEFD